LANFDSAAILALRQALTTQASASGLFTRVIGHEPKSPPGNGFSYCIWLGPVTSVGRVSGLGASAGRVEWTARIMTPFLQKSEDEIETDLMRRILQMIGLYSADITIGATVMEIDLLGAYGTGLQTSAIGYLEISGSHYRVAELTIPVIIDNLWTQAD
jgi:hypothetical protein